VEEAGMVSGSHAGQAPGHYTCLDKQFIGGQWRTGRAKGRLSDRNPYNDEVLVDIPHADERDLDDAFRTAAEEQKAWAQTLPSERSMVLQRAGAIMDARRDEIVSW